MKHNFVVLGMISLLVLFILPFGYYAVDFGQAGLRDALPEPHYLMSDSQTANLAIFSHMITGALVTVLVPIQLLPRLRSRWPLVHRWMGRIIIAAAVMTSVGGLAYLTLYGTIGGLHMTLGFALYGGLMLLAAIAALLSARRRDFAAHRCWALRFFLLAIGSWLYRVHYILWYIVTGGLGSNDTFSGPFDMVQSVAFYLPYLVGLEVYLRRKPAK